MFIVAKLHLFIDTASFLRAFLCSYQTESPTVPFISSNLYFDLKHFMNVIILKGLLDGEVTHCN